MKRFGRPSMGWHWTFGFSAFARSSVRLLWDFTRSNLRSAQVFQTLSFSPVVWVPSRPGKTNKETPSGFLWMTEILPSRVDINPSWFRFIPDSYTRGLRDGRTSSDGVLFDSLATLWLTTFSYTVLMSRKYFFRMFVHKIQTFRYIYHSIWMF